MPNSIGNRQPRYSDRNRRVGGPLDLPANFRFGTTGRSGRPTVVVAPPPTRPIMRSVNTSQIVTAKPAAKVIAPSSSSNVNTTGRSARAQAMANARARAAAARPAPPNVAPLAGSVQCTDWIYQSWAQIAANPVPDPSVAAVQTQPEPTNPAMGWFRTCYFPQAPASPDPQSATLGPEDFAGRLLALLSMNDEAGALQMLWDWFAQRTDESEVLYLIQIFASNGYPELGQSIGEAWNEAMGNASAQQAQPAQGQQPSAAREPSWASSAWGEPGSGQ